MPTPQPSTRWWSPAAAGVDRRVPAVAKGRAPSVQPVSSKVGEDRIVEAALIVNPVASPDRRFRCQPGSKLTRCQTVARVCSERSCNAVGAQELGRISRGFFATARLEVRRFLPELRGAVRPHRSANSLYSSETGTQGRRHARWAFDNSSGGRTFRQGKNDCQRPACCSAGRAHCRIPRNRFATKHVGQATARNLRRVAQRPPPARSSITYGSVQRHSRGGC